MNAFRKAYIDSPMPLEELMEFLESQDITCYGISLNPKNLRILYHNLMKRNLSVWDMQSEL